MKRSRSLSTYRKTVAVLFVIGSLGVPLAPTSAASAAIVTVGRPLTGTFSQTGASGTSYLASNKAFPGVSGQALSPVSGVVIRWNLINASGSFKLGVLHPEEGAVYTLTATSDSESPLTTGKESFATELPIAAGDAVGLEVSPGSVEGLIGESGGQSLYWEPAIAVGQTKAPNGTLPGLYGFNAEVLPPPTISSISATSGPSTGGTSVTITGDNFARVSSVKFGANAASTFSVGSEGSIDAVAPAGSGSAAVSVTTVAGTAVFPQPFNYSAPSAPAVTAPPASGLTSKPPPPATCRVPRLRGKTLKAAKNRIKAADCKLGKLTKKEGATAKDGEVVKQVPRPGATVPAGTRVNVTLAP